MILAIRTDSPTAELYILDAEGTIIDKKKWLAERRLAKDLLGLVADFLKNHGGFDGLSGLIVFKGPGSFTGLRIGITTANAIAYGEVVPIVGVNGDNWLKVGVTRLRLGENDRIILPEYGSDVHITTPIK